MTSGRIPIINGKREVVARMEWTGTLVRGKGKIRSDMKHREDAKKIRDVIKLRADLVKVRFKSASPRGYIHGWRGFEGNLNALNIALPAIGYYIDWDHVDWPVELPDGDKQIGNIT